MNKIFGTILNFLKRKTPVVILILVLLWLAPPFIVATAKGMSWTLGMILRLFGEKAAAWLQRIFQRIFEALLESKLACLGVGAAVAFVSPVVGFFLSVWCAMDHWKKYTGTLTLGVSPSPGPSPTKPTG